jgi:hypothetical protein
MNDRVDAIQSLVDLKTFVHAALCDKENLVREQFQMREMALTSRGRQCGMQFSLKGPRSVRLGAIWASDQNMLYFYDARGERFMKVKLRQRVFVDAPAA